MKIKKIRWVAVWVLAAVLCVSVQAFSLQPSAWAQEAVESAWETGLVPETLAGNYDAPITRAEFCALGAALYRVWDGNGQTADKVPQNVAFTDCGDEDVLLCASLGVVNGVGDGKFNPDAPIRRQEAAAMLHRLAALKNDYDSASVLPHVFSDGADLRAWARSDVYWAYENGIMQGVGENRFDPDGSYTREQSILTILRLYDHSWATQPQELPEYPYHEVVDSAGVGVLRVHLEDAAGNHVLTDIGDSGGYFYTTAFFGKWISVTWDSGIDMALYVPETGRLMEGYMLDHTYPPDEEHGVGWAWEANMTRNRVVLHADGTTGGTYLPLSGWHNGRAVVWLDSDTLGAIDAEENVLWTCQAPGDQETMVTNSVGDRVEIQQDGGWVILLDGGRLSPVISGSVRLCLWSDSYLVQINGAYTLYDRSGKALCGPYWNALDEVGQDLYSRWIDNSHYEYFRCVPGGTPEPLFSVYTVNGRPGALPTDGGGVYALRTDTREITCFDRFGDILGVINTDFNIDIYTNIKFEDGCVRVDHTYATQDTPVLSALYLPTGERLE